MENRVCHKCGGAHHAKGLCSKHYYQRPEVKAKKRAYCQRPEVKEHQREHQREYYQRPEVKEHQREYRREYCQRPEVKAKTAESQKHNAVATLRALVNARKFLSEETARAFVLDGALLKKRERELKREFKPNEKAFLKR